MAVDPIQDEFFKTELVGDFSNALLRETIQNSLDAKANKIEPVHISISIHRNNGPISDPVYQSFFTGLDEHLRARNNGLMDRPSPDESMDFLVIEDFNTTGLEGDTLIDINPADESARENFFYFWRNYGRSGKSGTELGRWGLGKTVFSAISKINTFFGLTIRESDARSLLMGQSVLKIHNIGSQTYVPYGGFGTFGKTEGERSFPIPIEDKSVLRNFSKTFCLSRTTEPGFSIVVPYPYQDITLHTLETGVVTQFFYPIMAGELSITLRENGTPAPVKLNRESVIALITNGTLLTSEFEGESDDVNLIRLFSFAKAAIEMLEEEYIRLVPPQDLNAMPVWHDDMFQEISLTLLRKRFDQGDMIGFLVPLKVQIPGHQARLNWFRAYVQRDATLQSAENYFLRKGIRISGITSFRDRGIRGMIVIDEGDLVTLIGDAENPAHTEWQKNSSKFRNKYKHGARTLDFVKASLREIIRRLLKPAEGIDTELLGDVFYIDIPETKQSEDERKKGSDKKEKGDKPAVGPDVDVESGIRPVLMSKVTGGIRIYGNPKNRKEIASAEFRFAYAVRKGNAINKYRKPDFDLGKEPITITGTGINITEASENVLKFEVTDPEYTLTVSGFDEQRDLVVRSYWSEVSS